MNPRSLENLIPNNRYQGKIRCNFSLLPETKEWLHQHGNASAKIDELVRILRG
ncbi:hypothetical protein [Oscillatoria sp. FACHB-1406]|uniref:hypothetical protein n=1 Tax=Oscillatoria sp. FACHB-1406 TaxID=2692846 RepID=UPI001682496C|nr:hypothetical protein [Oscillatoria sp. FACHB-1406]MBD2578639.1 hypothetical protein [Oscillatoria sp. FACHB-1406]